MSAAPTEDQERWYAANIPLRGQRIVDVGANEGRLSQFFWDAGAGTNSVYSVEPIPRNVDAIRARIAAAGARTWTVEPCAISSVEGEVELEVFPTPEGIWNGAVVASGSTASDTAIRVRCRTLTTLCPDAHVVKLDIEGHEYAVLDEALLALHTVHTWALELHMVADRPLQAVLAQLAAAGFRTLAAGRRPDDPQGPWNAVEVGPALGWDRIPIAQTRPDGSVFKMLHVLARRDRGG